MRFIHCADLHLDSPLRGLERYEGAPVQEMREATRRSFFNIIDLALEREVDFILIAGDVFDGDLLDFNAGLFFSNQLRRLADANIRAFTCGRFDKVATDFDEDMTILVGVRPGGKRENVGNLSSGTRDQLFLALRLAAIESHVANQEPMPVVVDDIVINFDDASASATFRVLAELSKKTQVLFFTHHEHLLERAASAIGKEAFTAHKL